MSVKLGEGHKPHITGRELAMSAYQSMLSPKGDYARIVKRRIAEIQKVKKEHALWLKTEGKKLGVK
jgi:hypothetical protein